MHDGLVGNLPECRIERLLLCNRVWFLIDFHGRDLPSGSNTIPVRGSRGGGGWSQSGQRGKEPRAKSVTVARSKCECFFPPTLAQFSSMCWLRANGHAVSMCEDTVGHSWFPPNRLTQEVGRPCRTKVTHKQLEPKH
jgi:hypothetical protein